MGCCISCRSRFVGTPSLSAAILLGGRALLGGAESFVITGAVSWGLALAGPANTGRVIAWVGMAMFAALAFGAPVGTTLYALGGFTAVAVATIVASADHRAARHSADARPGPAREPKAGS